MYFGAIKELDVADGPGVRVSLFVSGCTHHCVECFQPETWNFEFGELYTKEIEQKILNALKPNYIEGLTILGGEPFEPSNQRELVSLLQKVRKQYPMKNIWVFSGYLYEELTGKVEGTGRAYCEVSDDMMSLIDVLVDGEFVLEKKDLSLQFRGSSNQRLIDVQKSLQAGEVVWWNAEKK